MMNLRQFFKSLSGKEPPDRTQMRGYYVRCNEDGVEARRPNGEISSIKWEQLNTVIAQAHEPVPGLPSMMWILGGDSAACVVPQSAKGEEVFIQWIEQLPGFNHDELRKARASEKDQSFTIWERPSTHDDD